MKYHNDLLHSIIRIEITHEELKDSLGAIKLMHNLADLISIHGDGPVIDAHRVEIDSARPGINHIQVL